MSPKRIIGTLLKDPTGNIGVQLMRYLVSGGVAFLADTGLLALLTESFGQEHLLVWTALSFALGLLITYLFSIKWVFDNRSLSNRYAEISIFILIGVSGLLLTELFMWLLTGKCGIHYILSKIITTILVFFWNFALKKTLLFRSSKK